MEIIFLDIDGVMIPTKSWEKTELLTDGFGKFSEDSIKALNKLLTDETKVILTTSHRFSYSVGVWKDIFKKRGINIVNMDILPYLGMANRKDSILEWFEDNESDNYLIIDDDKSLNDLPLEMKEKLILTSPMIGLK